MGSRMRALRKATLRPGRQQRGINRFSLAFDSTIRATDPAPPLGYIFSPWDGFYEKEFYWLGKLNKKNVVKCYPNAGFMNAVDGSGRMWGPKAKDIMVSMIPEDESYP